MSCINMYFFIISHLKFGIKRVISLKLSLMMSAPSIWLFSLSQNFSHEFLHFSVKFLWSDFLIESFFSFKSFLLLHLSKRKCFFFDAFMNFKFIILSLKFVCSCPKVDSRLYLINKAALTSDSNWSANTILEHSISGTYYKNQNGI